MNEFNVKLINGMKANFYYELGKEEVSKDYTYFKLGDIALGLVSRSCSRSWDYASAGTFYEVVSTDIEYSEPILVKIDTDYYRLPDEVEGNCLIAFLDPNTEELIAYITIVYPDGWDQAYCTFKVVQTATAVTNNLQERLLR